MLALFRPLIPYYWVHAQHPQPCSTQSSPTPISFTRLQPACHSRGFLEGHPYWASLCSLHPAAATCSYACIRSLARWLVGSYSRARDRRQHPQAGTVAAWAQAPLPAYPPCPSLLLSPSLSSLSRICIRCFLHNISSIGLSSFCSVRHFSYASYLHKALCTWCLPFVIHSTTASELSFSLSLSHSLSLCLSLSSSAQPFLLLLYYHFAWRHWIQHPSVR